MANSNENVVWLFKHKLGTPYWRQTLGAELRDHEREWGSGLEELKIIIIPTVRDLILKKAYLILPKILPNASLLAQKITYKGSLIKDVAES